MLTRVPKAFDGKLLEVYRAEQERAAEAARQAAIREREWAEEWERNRPQREADEAEAKINSALWKRMYAAAHYPSGKARDKFVECFHRWLKEGKPETGEWEKGNHR